MGSRSHRLRSREAVRLYHLTEAGRHAAETRATETIGEPLKKEKVILSILRESGVELFGLRIFEIANGDLRRDGRDGVYRTLRRMEEKGLVVSRWQRSSEKTDRRMYRLTRTGREACGEAVEPLDGELVALDGPLQIGLTAVEEKL